MVVSVSVSFSLSLSLVMSRVVGWWVVVSPSLSLYIYFSNACMCGWMAASASVCLSEGERERRNKQIDYHQPNHALEREGERERETEHHATTHLPDGVDGWIKVDDFMGGTLELIVIVSQAVAGSFSTMSSTMRLAKSLIFELVLGMP